MAKLPLCLCALFALTNLIAGPALSAKAADKKAKEAKIKSLEEEIHKLHEQEKTTLKGIDENYDRLIRSLEPKEVKKQLEEILIVMENVRKIISIGEFDYGGHRHAAQESVKKAEHQVEKALKHDTPEERHKTAEDLQADHKDISEALAYSIEKYGLGNGKDKAEPESRVAANQQLAAEVPKIGFAYQLLGAVDHEIKDFKEEKKVLHAKRDAAKHEAKEQFSVKIKGIEEEIKALKK